MEDLNKADLKLFFDEEIYLIKEATGIEPTQKEEQKPLVVEKPETEHLPLVYKGGNTKGIVIIINDDSNEFLNNMDETLLLNILKAIGLSLNDVAIINQYNSSSDWKKQLEFAKVIAFGVQPGNYNITIGHYIIHSVDDVKWLFSDSLTELASNKVLKGKLWGKLQELF